jgi:predicted ATPase
MRGIVHCHLGRFADARRDLGAILEIDNDALHGDTELGGGDLRVVARTYLSRTNAIFGYPDKSDQIASEGLTIARQIGHPFSICWALASVGRSNLFAGKYADAVRFLDESIKISDQYGYISRLGQSMCFRGISKVGLGDITSGITEIGKGLDLWKRSSGKFSTEMLLVISAGMFVQSGCLEEARFYLEEARAYYASYPERDTYAEFLRIDGLLSLTDGDRASARTKFEQAISVAESQSANRYRLRASRDLAQLLAEDGDIEGARNVLAPVYAWFTEGFDAPDIKQAKALLDGLNQK